MDHCRTCGKQTTDPEAPTCGAVPCIRIDLAAEAVCAEWRRALDDSVRSGFMRILKEVLRATPNPEETRQRAPGHVAGPSTDRTLGLGGQTRTL